MAKLSVAVDIILLSYRRKKVELLLVERKYPPFQGCWALPGGFVEEQEPFEEAAHRELVEETGVKDIKLQPLPRFFDGPERDPRGRVISAVYWGLVAKPSQVQAGSDARAACWFPIAKLPALAFDHAIIIESVRNHIKSMYNFSLPLFEAMGNVRLTKFNDILAQL